MSATGLTGMAATIAQGDDLLHVVSEYQPYLLRQWHVDLKVCQEGPRTGAMMLSVVFVFMHVFSFQATSMKL
jgi:hypothetical protein